MVFGAPSPGEEPVPDPTRISCQSGATSPFAMSKFSTLATEYLEMLEMIARSLTKKPAAYTKMAAKPKLMEQNLETLVVEELTPLTPEVISRQATINIGKRPCCIFIMVSPKFFQILINTFP